MCDRALETHIPGTRVEHSLFLSFVCRSMWSITFRYFFSHFVFVWEYNRNFLDLGKMLTFWIMRLWMRWSLAYRRISGEGCFYSSVRSRTPVTREKQVRLMSIEQCRVCHARIYIWIKMLVNFTGYGLSPFCWRYLSIIDQADVWFASHIVDYWN